MYERAVLREHIVQFQRWKNEIHPDISPNSLSDMVI